MSSKQIIAVTGATGAQGGSVAKYLLNDGTFAVRAITRNVQSPAAKKLAALGADVVMADLRDPVSLQNAFHGAFGVFGVTNFWEPGVGFEGEALQGKNLVDAAKAANIKHLVWSSLEHTRLSAKHFESKAFVDDYLKASGVPRTSLFTAYYFENFINLFRIKERADGSYDFPFPFPADLPFMVYPADETGAYVLSIFLDSTNWIGKDLRVTTDFMTLRQMLTTIAEVSGKTIHVPEVSQEEWKASRGTTLSEEQFVTMAVLYDSFGAPPSRDPELSHRLNPKMKTFRQWVAKNLDNLVS